ncbi:hypothetical protein [Pirellulimonas nuda]|uniref:hypothetical protein n=1 Tax=Pirellulimonas nuda TaxID=2528009 RepID=UPI0011AB1B16|nr:hypothetical protein [Pirellulimonas nuda]
MRPERYAVLFVLSVACAGCSERTAAVSGTVKLDKAPLAITEGQRGMVVFRPVAGGATCTSLIGADGGYRVATGAASGVVPGDYMVSVRVIELVQGAEGEGASGRPITPAVYSDPLTSGLLYTVQSGANQIDIPLESSAGPAVIPSPPQADIDDATPAETAEPTDHSEAPSGETEASKEASDDGGSKNEVRPQAKPAETKEPSDEVQ